MQSVSLPEEVFREETLSESVRNKMHFNDGSVVGSTSKYGD